MTRAAQLDHEVAMALAHRLTFDGYGRSLLGRCKCGTAFLQGLGRGTPRQQIQEQYARHLEYAKARMELDAP
jgi:hypothetical protein